MKKILFYIDTMYRGGAQRVMSVLLEHYVQIGCSVVLVNDFIQGIGSPQYPTNDNVKRLYLLKDNSGRFLNMQFRRFFALRKIVKREKPDIVVSFLASPNIRMLFSTLGLNTKKIVSVRNDPNKEYGSKWFIRSFIGLTFRLANGCVFQTEDAKAYFPHSIQNKSKIILNPVDKKFFASTYCMSKSKDIITVGRMESQKNHKLLIEAFSLIAKDIRDNLIIYGDGPLRQKLFDQIQEYHLDDRVFLPGIASDIEKKYMTAKVFVLSSDYEGLPNVLMEALASGVPSISTDCPCGGPKMLIRNGFNGFLIPCNDKKALADKMMELINDSHKRSFFSTNSKQMANDYNTEEILRQWDSYLLD